MIRSLTFLNFCELFFEEIFALELLAKAWIDIEGAAKG